MNQKFYEEVGSMSEEKAKKLMALFNKDPEMQDLVTQYFEGKELPQDKWMPVLQAIIYLRNMQKVIE